MQAKQNEARLQISLFQSLGKMVTGLVPENELDALVFKSDNFNAVTHVYPAFARNERLQDIFDGNWSCLGKVIGIIKESETYDLMKGSPIGYFARSQFNNITSRLRSEELNIEISDQEVSGYSMPWWRSPG